MMEVDWNAGWSSPVARQAHNLKVAGSNPAPATNLNPAHSEQGFLMCSNGQYQVYVLQNAAGRFYIGLSENVAFRLAQHNNGVSKWTRLRGPWSLVWTSRPLNLSEAMKLERRLKRHKGGIGFYLETGLPRFSGS